MKQFDSSSRYCLLLFGFLASAVVEAAEPIPLRAGPLTMVFDADNAFLRYVKAGPYEVLRGINAPIRNQSWGTVRPKVSNLRVQDKGNHFSLSFDAICQEGGVDFRWRGSIVGSPAGDVEFALEGVAHSTFLRNRIGFCVLHGPSAAGKPWVIQHVGGKKSRGRFPFYISPHQPAKEIRAIAHELTSGIWANVEFEGDVFEMEDQRNWTDASFKTYCTPLELPYPVEVREGTRISQRIRFRVEGDVPESIGSENQVVLALREQESPMPRLGLQVSSEAVDISERQLQWLKALRLDHLRIDLQSASHSVAEDLQWASAQANALGATLHVGIRFGEHPETELPNLIRGLQETAPNVAMYLIISANQQHYEMARRRLKSISGNARMGVAKDTNFVDLNRDRPATKDIGVVSYAINPQIHAFDNASMVETLPIQADTVRTARLFVGKTPLAIGPITLKSRPVSQESSSEALPADVDVRQPTRFAAAWTLGSIKYLAEVGVSSATYYETVGWKGVIDLEQSKSRPDGFPSTPGQVFPVYHILRNVAEFAAGSVQLLDSSDSLSVVGLAMKKPGRMRILIANLTDRDQLVSLPDFAPPLNVWVLDSQTVAAAYRDPEAWHDQAANQVMKQSLVLPPHAIARIDRSVD